jgi:8-oxo-dGTP pyrophosphatase MutT (NUDIX family)
MIKIFINDKPLLLVQQKPLQNNPEMPVMAFNEQDINTYFKHCESLSSKGLVLIAPNPELAFLSFKKQLVCIEAAGGAVFNNLGRLLMIKRMGKWDLPKGKIDAGETKEMAAIREVEEECGITHLQILKPLTTTYHTYKMHNHRFLKITHWFFMFSQFTGKLVPQKEEQITDVVWMNVNELDTSEIDTYNSIRSLLNQIKESAPSLNLNLF